MTERERIYDRLCFTLTEYEQSDNHEGWDNTLYSMLRDIQNNWECVITSEE